MTGFYYHTGDFDASEVAEKCVKRLDDVPNDFDDVTVEQREEVSPSEVIGSNLTEDWVAPNYTESIVEFDTPYEELNEKSQEKETQRLRDEKGQLFVLEVELDAGDSRYAISALIEIRGRAGGGKTEFFIEEFRQGDPGIGG